MIIVLYIYCVGSVFGIGPPGVQPPPTFEAEEWYPSNLPTVEPARRVKPVSTSQSTETLTATPETVTRSESVFDSTPDESSSTSSTNSAILSPLPLNNSDFVAFDASNTVGQAMMASVQDSKITAVAESTTAEKTNAATNKTSTPTEIKQQNVLDVKEERSEIDRKQQNSGNVNDCPDIFFVLDSSGNALDQYERQKLVINAIIAELRNDSRHYGLMTYAGKSRQRINVPLQPQISQSAFTKELAGARFLSGVTATGSALRALTGFKFLRSTDIIIITDGFSFDSVEEESKQLRSLMGIRVFVTGNYSPVLKDVLTQITGDPERVLLGDHSIPRLVNFLQC